MASDRSDYRKDGSMTRSAARSYGEAAAMAERLGTVGNVRPDLLTDYIRALATLSIENAALRRKLSRLTAHD